MPISPASHGPYRNAHVPAARKEKPISRNWLTAMVNWLSTRLSAASMAAPARLAVRRTSRAASDRRRGKPRRESNVD